MSGNRKKVAFSFSCLIVYFHWSQIDCKEKKKTKGKSWKKKDQNHVENVFDRMNYDITFCALDFTHE